MDPFLRGVRESSFSRTFMRQWNDVTDIAMGGWHTVALKSSLGTIDFAPGETTKTLTIGVKGDDIPEDDETFTVVLHTLPEADQIDMVTAQGMIRDDDPFQILIHPARRDDVFAFSAAPNDGSFLDPPDVQRYVVRSTRDFRTWKTESEPLVSRDGILHWEDGSEQEATSRFFSSSGERHNWETVRFQPNIRSTGSNVLQ